MPRYPYNNLAYHFWQETPPNWPWRTEDDRNLVWNRDLPATLLHVSQELAVLYGSWIKPLTDGGPEAKLLVAASLSLPRLGGLLDRMTAVILRAAHYSQPRGGAIKHWRGKRPSRAEAFTGLLCVLEGIQYLGDSIAGGDYCDLLKKPDPLSADVFVRLGFSDTGRSRNALLAHSLVARALENDWNGVRSALQNLPSETVLYKRLNSGLRLAAEEFFLTSRQTLGEAPESVAYEQAVAALRAATTERPLPAWRTWHAVTEAVHATGQAWRRVRWVDSHGNEANQSLRLQLLKEEARVRQYALLMRGNGRRHRAMIMLGALHLLLGTARRYAITLGGKWSGHTQQIQRLFDVDIVEPDVRERWEAAMAGPLKKCEQLIRIATRDGQAEPWMLRKHYRQFVEKGVVGGKSDAYRKRQIVEELLAPMQAIGLAAQVPWDRVLQSDVARRKSGASRPRVTLDTCHGKAWVVNPLGIVYRPGKRSSRR